MKIYDFKELLDKAHQDGFTAKSISKATNVPIDLIDRYYEEADVSANEIQPLGCVLSFIMELYRDDIGNDDYIKTIVQTLNDYFDVPNQTIANYLNISAKEFEKLLQTPFETKEYCCMSLKILYLFMSFVRD